MVSVFWHDMDVQQIRLALVVNGPYPHRPCFWERVATPLPPEPKREEHIIDGSEVRFVPIGNDKIEIALAGAAKHRATANMFDRRIR